MAQAPPLQELTADNHGPGVVVSSLIFVIIAAATVLTRLLTRFKVARKLVLDDYFTVCSIILSVVQTAAIIVASNHGLGRHRDAITPTSFAVYAKASYAADILLVAALACAKASVACLIIGLNPPTRITVQCYIALGVVGAWALGSILINAFQCSLPDPWDLNGNCINLFAVDIYNTAMNVLTDLALIVIPFLLMQEIQVSAQKRWLVIGLFGSRLIVVAFSIVAIIVRREAFVKSGDLTWDLVTSTIWVQGMVAVSIMTACLPSIRRFLSDFKTGMMGVHISEPLEMTMKHSLSGPSSPVSQPRNSVATSNLVKKLRLGSLTLSNTTANSQQSQVSHREKFDLGRKGHSRTVIERSESKRISRQNVILQTIDYEVEYQESTAAEMKGSLGADMPASSVHSSFGSFAESSPSPAVRPLAGR